MGIKTKMSNYLELLYPQEIARTGRSLAVSEHIWCWLVNNVYVSCNCRLLLLVCEYGVLVVKLWVEISNI